MKISFYKRPPIKQRKPPAPEPNYPKCKAIYEYTAADSDEISFKEDDLIYIIKEGDTDISISKIFYIQNFN